MKYFIYVCPECHKQAGHYSPTVCQHFDPEERYIKMIEVEVKLIEELK